MTMVVVKSVPAIFTGVNNWGWVNMSELCEMLGLTPTEIFWNYGDLSKDAQDGILAVVWFGVFQDVKIDVLVGLEAVLRDMARDRDIDEDFLISEWQKATFVPAGWVNDLLEARGKGYIRVVLKDMYFDSEGDRNNPDYLRWSHKTGFDNQFSVVVGYKD